ncbi:hypothetical protein PACTADRAFT_50070 [Pachysolen tannophilus NRRL Y-2460]|uniref:DUF3533 domain-containing protein n=1 Tax=Pachysolen tannophilus NRRL Y-2460 TaxID=669874 RepID=A0A1E4TUC1_PACTA|nr:hypothetical protein PACTADRAFT_50070 [Pachysolen tannophilus NRRL Y-2460]
MSRRKLTLESETSAVDPLDKKHLQNSNNLKNVIDHNIHTKDNDRIEEVDSYRNESNKANGDGQDLFNSNFKFNSFDSSESHSEELKGKAFSPDEDNGTESWHFSDSKKKDTKEEPSYSKSRMSSPVESSPERDHDNEAEARRNGSRKSKFKLFSKIKVKQNSKWFVYLMFLRVYVTIFIGFVGILSIYWGSYYARTTRYKNLKFLVVIEDDTVVGDTQPYIGNSLIELLQTDEAKYYGDWNIYNSTSFQGMAAEHENTIGEEVLRQVHHQLYWGAIHVKANSTYLLFESILNNSTMATTDTYIDCYYETGRDMSAVSLYILPFLQIISKLFVENSSLTILNNFFADNSGSSTSDAKTLILNGIDALMTKLPFNFIDNRPASSSVILGPSEMGLVYCLVLSFHQFNFSSKIHAELNKKLKAKSFLVFRLLSSQISFFVLSLVYCLITIAYRVSISEAFGKSGFLVLWAFIFLTMSALGGITENVALFIVARNRAYIGFWIVFFIVINVSPTFSIIALCPHFYRYGYALPIHSAKEALNVIFFNTYKDCLRRDIGVLVGWIVLSNIALPFSLRACSKHMAKQATKEKKKEADEEIAKEKAEKVAKQSST